MSRGGFRNFYAMRRNGYSGPFFSALALIAMSVWLMLPIGAFEAPISPVYEVMAQVANELGWGIFLLLCASLMLSASYRRRPREVAIGSLGATIGYFTLFASYAAANWRLLPVPLLLVLTVRSMSIYREFMARQDDPHLQLPHRFDPNGSDGTDGRRDA